MEETSHQEWHIEGLELSLILFSMKTITTSSQFAAVSATGENWRDITKKILEQLESLKTDGFKPNVGFLYMTENLSDDARSIQTLLKSVTGITHWTGTSAMGICANGGVYWDVPAMVVLIGEFASDQARHFHASESDLKKLDVELKPWLNTHDPMLTILHVNPSEKFHAAPMIEDIDALVGGFMVGGFTSYKNHGGLVGMDDMDVGACGFVFSEDVVVATSLSQGCIPMGKSHEVSKAGDYVIAYLDGKKPFDVFSEDMRTVVEKRLGYRAQDRLMESGIIGADFQKMLEGQAHIAFPVAGSDQKDFVVRNIMAIDPENGEIAVNEILEDGQHILFAYRDDETVRADLSASLVSLRDRVIRQTGDFKPKAALYVSCVARASVDFAGDGTQGGEMELIKEILGDIPMAGFYASAEISAGRLYGYTGVLTLFL